MNEIPEWVEFTFYPWGGSTFWGAATGYSKAEGIHPISIWTFHDYLHWKNHESSIPVVHQLEND